ncbi:MAG: hypothetical protein GYA48_15270 [Chloroflexi bacterium]|nr:hypothetical protein [Chloroflexota bacterium]
MASFTGTKKKIYCPKCQRVVGDVVIIENREWLKVNGIAVNVMRGVCLECGAEFHWSISERMLSQLVEHVIKLRDS